MDVFVFAFIHRIICYVLKEQIARNLYFINCLSVYKFDLLIKEPRSFAYD